MSYPNKDRNDYRVMSVDQLIEEARDNPNSELAIALGERLSDMDLALEEKREPMDDRWEAPHL